MSSAIKFIFSEEVTEEEYDNAYNFLTKLGVVSLVITLITIIL